MKTLCAFGTCKKSASADVKTTNMTTKEARKFCLCKDHLASLLDTCHRDGLLVNFSSHIEGRAS